MKPEVAFVDDQGRVMVADDPDEPNVVHEYVSRDRVADLIRGRRDHYWTCSLTWAALDGILRDLRRAK